MSIIVLYAKQDFEPITVIRVPYTRGEINKIKMPWFKVAVMPPINISSRFETTPPDNVHFKSVLIEIERFIRNGQEILFFVTSDEDTALELRGDVLPGQRKRFQEEFERGFAEGLLRSFS